MLLLKHNRRLKQRDSLPLNMQLGELGDRNFGSPTVWSRGKVLRVWGRSSPEAEAVCTFAYNILTLHGQELGCPDIVHTNGLTPLLGGLGAVPPAGSKGKAPVQGVWSRKLFAAQVADFCLIRRFFWGEGVLDFCGIYPLE